MGFRTGHPHIPEPPKLVVPVGRHPEEPDARNLATWLQSYLPLLVNWMRDTLRGILDLLQNEFDVRTAYDVEHTFGQADVEEAISHPLGVTPRYCYVIQADRSAVVYQGSTSWTHSTVYVKCNATNATVTLRIER